MILFPSPLMTPVQTFGAYLVGPFDLAVTVSSPIPASTITKPIYGAFKRLWVNYLFKGQSFIYWEFNEGFADPGPYSFQLQATQGGTPRADDWFDVGEPTTAFFAIDDGGQKMFGKSPTLNYRVIMTTPLATYISMNANMLGLLNKHDWVIIREILRKEQLAHRIFSSVKGYLFKARRYGPECIHSRDQAVKLSTSSGDVKFTDEVIDTNCSTCYGTGFVNGYYPATEYYGLLTNEQTREYRGEQGTMKPVNIKGRFIATLPLVQGDVWVNIGSDERYYIHGIAESAGWKSVPVVYEAELRLAPFTDAVYDIPLRWS